eukprot:NODE_97_length_21155_cov_0.234850.p16 type:complete len:135 gc:universal NODE_97_length_21155_cov_0.234850:17751-17347(-)
MWICFCCVFPCSAAVPALLPALLPVPVLSSLLNCSVCLRLLSRCRLRPSLTSSLILRFSSVYQPWMGSLTAVKSLKWPRVCLTGYGCVHFFWPVYARVCPDFLPLVRFLSRYQTALLHPSPSRLAQMSTQKAPD